MSCRASRAARVPQKQAHWPARRIPPAPLGHGRRPANLTESGHDVTAPILVFPHHGGRSGSGNVSDFARELCNLVHPKTVVFSIGRGEHGTPQPDVVETIRQVIPDIRIACTQLSAHCTTVLPASLPTHLANKYARGREYGKCCAGTIVIDFLPKEVTVTPGTAQHQEYISQFRATALCMRPITVQPKNGKRDVL